MLLSNVIKSDIALVENLKFFTIVAVSRNIG